jgi:hypothetical protein
MNKSIGKIVVACLIVGACSFAIVGLSGIGIVCKFLQDKMQ